MCRHAVYYASIYLKFSFWVSLRGRIILQLFSLVNKSSQGLCFCEQLYNRSAYIVEWHNIISQELLLMLCLGSTCVFCGFSTWILLFVQNLLSNIQQNAGSSQGGTAGNIVPGHMVRGDHCTKSVILFLSPWIRTTTSTWHLLCSVQTSLDYWICQHVQRMGSYTSLHFHANSLC